MVKLAGKQMDHGRSWAKGKVAVVSFSNRGIYDKATIHYLVDIHSQFNIWNELAC